VFLINKTLLKMSKGFRGWIALIAALKILVLFGITLFATSLSSVLGSLFQTASAPEIKPQILRALAAALVMLAGNALIGEAEYRCTAKARLTLRRRILEKVLELDVGKVDRLGASNNINSAVDGVETMQVYYNRYLPGLVYGIVSPVFTFFVLKNRCLPAAVLLLFCAILIPPVNNLFRGIIEKLKSGYWHDLNDLTGYYLESVNSLTTTELYGRSEDREATLEKKARNLSSTIISVMKSNFSTFSFNEGLMNTATFAASAIACAQMLHGKIDLISALTVLMLSYGFFSSFRQVQYIAHDALLGIAASQNVAEVLNINTELPFREDNDPNPNGEGLRLQDVTFAYEGRPPVLKGVDMEFPAGTTTAIVGESGCGKSTIVNMLLRFYDPAGGRLTYNGRDFMSMDVAELRRQVIMVPQTVYVFTGTVRDNLLLANPRAKDGELRDVLNRVRLLSWVDSQPEGLDTPVGDAGSRLSGGQRQKIGIARALLSKAPYIIFDEATSSVDETSEQEIRSCIRELALERTLIIISHRLSAVRDADRIYVMEDGVCSQSGSHDELMARGGLYSRLVQEQDRLEMLGKRRRSE